MESSGDPQFESTRAQSTTQRRRRRRYRRLKAVAILPSLFTLGNLIAGFAAIHYASKPMDDSAAGPLDWTPLTMAGSLIFLGMFFDAVDGSIARITRTTSDIGAQLDSIADIVTFGVAPAYMTLRLVSMYYLEGNESAYAVISPDHDDVFGRVFWVIAAIYVCCAALRLARFSVETGEDQLASDHMVFRGLPSPGAAGCLASLILVHQEQLKDIDLQWVARTTGFGMAGIMLLCSIAMVGRLPYIHFTNRFVRGQASFSYVVTVAVVLAFTAFNTQEMLAIGFTVYALSAPVRSLWLVWRRRSRAAAIQRASSAKAARQSTDSRPAS